MKTMTITWDRIGRNHSVPPLVMRYDPEDEHSVAALVDTIDHTIRRHLSSRFFDWSMEIDGGRLTIDGGRFGGGVGVVSEVTHSDEGQVTP